MISLRQGTLAFLFAAASATVAQSQSLSGLPVTCKGERISRIDVDASPPFRITGDKMWHRWGRFAAKQHVTTRDAVIRRYLALQLGSQCTELRRAESERILRAQPFLADATVLAYADGAGGVILNVTTVDEISLILGLGNTSKVSPLSFVQARRSQSPRQRPPRRGPVEVGRALFATLPPAKSSTTSSSAGRTCSCWREADVSWGAIGRRS